MGSNQGVVWNDSDFLIQYVVYGKFQEIGDSKIKTTINPKIDIAIQAEGGSLKLEGFSKETESSINSKYAESFVQVPPGRFVTSGLTQLKMDQHKISVRVRVGKYIKYLLKDIIIKHDTDMCLKIRQDFSIKNMHGQQASGLVKQNAMKSSNPADDAHRRQRQDKVYKMAIQQFEKAEKQ